MLNRSFYNGNIAIVNLRFTHQQTLALLVSNR
jgi:hypothetical protein